jgi:hypothetical protein
MDRLYQRRINNNSVSQTNPYAANIGSSNSRSAVLRKQSNGSSYSRAPYSYDTQIDGNDSLNTTTSQSQSHVHTRRSTNDNARKSNSNNSRKENAKANAIVNNGRNANVSKENSSPRNLVEVSQRQSQSSLDNREKKSVQNTRNTKSFNAHKANNGIDIKPDNRPQSSPGASSSIKRLFRSLFEYPQK